MTRDLCDMSLQQARELVRLTASSLQGICSKKFSRQELYVEALRKVLGGKGRRGPRSIFIVSPKEKGESYSGRVFHLREGEMVEGSDFITMEPDSRYLSSLQQRAEVTSNWCDSCP